MVLETLGGATLAAAGAMAYAVRGRSAAWFGPSVWRGADGRRSVALTFDDGPSESTPDLLRLLEGAGVRATFFLCGVNVRRLPSIANEIRARGHEIGNHTDTHPLLCFKTLAFIDGEISRAQDSIEAAAGVRPRLFRAPFGARWFGLRAVQSKHKLVGVMWTAIGRDWALNGPNVARRLLRAAAPGSIFCLHDGRDTEVNPDIRSTLEATRILLDQLGRQGYRFQTVSELLCPTTS